ncbi:MAG TPA: aromatic ring-hydroxylating dioxygenase subunit alpha [Acidimicrobiales bacterium]|nr:aromatic ring-hydroxylating dioxygenase subunit alpha [Acidimicrobiales bacterium]
MDADYLALFRERSAAETARSAAPDGFPALPDIPLGRYTDPAFHALEQALLFEHTWLYAGHDSELPGPGAYKLADIAGAALLLVRGDDGEVRAFHNACRHRGAPVVRDARGTARLLVCQFHSWTYDLQGRLARVPDERDFVGLCPEQRALPAVRCERWGGWWFVNFDHDAPPLLEWLDPIPTLLADVARSPLRVIDEKHVELGCNWKILAEGFLEVYHARTVHPTTVAPTLDTRGTVVSLFDHGHQNMLSPVKPGTRADGREALATLAHVPAVMREHIQPAHGIFPNIISPLDARGFPFLVFWPVAIDRTRLDIVWFVADWGEGDLPGAELWRKRLERFDLLMEEDYRNLEPIQRSMKHAAHGGQVVNYQERRIWHVHAWIDKVIGPERIPDELRVPDLLADWVDHV